MNHAGASAKVNFCQSNAVSIKRPILRHAQGCAAAVSARGLQHRATTGNQVKPSGDVASSRAEGMQAGIPAKSPATDRPPAQQCPRSLRTPA